MNIQTSHHLRVHYNHVWGRKTNIDIQISIFECYIMMSISKNLYLDIDIFWYQHSKCFTILYYSMLYTNLLLNIHIQIRHHIRVQTNQVWGGRENILIFKNVTWNIKVFLKSRKFAAFCHVFSSACLAQIRSGALYQNNIVFLIRNV